MAQIDELIAVMMERHADALILHSYQPARLNFGGTLASGAIVAPQLLRTMLREIVPPAHSDRLRGESAFGFSHSCASGLMKVQVERHGLDFHVIITPYSSPRVFVPPADAKPVYQTYQPPVDASFATPSRPIYTPPTLPGYPIAPIVNGGGAPNAQGSTASNSPAPLPRAAKTQPANFPAPVARAPVVKAKPKMDGFLVFSASILFCSACALFVTVFGWFALWAFFVFAALAILMDSYLVGVQTGLLDGMGNCGPWTWFFFCLYFGFIGIPAYLVTRPIYQHALDSNSKPPP